MDDAGGRHDGPIDLTKPAGASPVVTPMGPGMPEPSGYLAPNLPPPPRISKRRIIGIAVALVVVLGGTIGNALNREAASHAQVGDCMRVNELGEAKAGAVDQHADLDRVDCTDPAAIFSVGMRLADDTADCPAGDYIEYWERGGDGGDFKLCLAYNLAVGDCWEEADKPLRVACTAGAGHDRYKAVKVVDGVADGDKCAGAAKARVAYLTYSQPAKTVCFTPV